MGAISLRGRKEGQDMLRDLILRHLKSIFAFSPSSQSTFLTPDRSFLDALPVSQLSDHAKV